MSPRQPRRIIDSSDDESLPETWEEMQRNIEPVSPAGPQQQQVITIDDTPQQAPLGGEPPFEVILSMTEDTPAPPPELAPEPEPRPPEPEPAPEPALDPEPAPESPQPGPSGIEEMNQNGAENEYCDEYFLRIIDDSVGTLNQDIAEFASAKKVIQKAKKGLQMVHMMLDICQDTVVHVHDYKEAYRTSRRVHKRKLDHVDELESKLKSETKKFKDELDAHARQTNETLEANLILHRQIEVEKSEARDYMEQRDQAEHIVDELKSKLTREKTKVFNLKKYNAALKEAMEDKDKTIGRLETELNQTRQRLHQFTRISVPRRPAASVQADESSSSSEEEDN